MLMFTVNTLILVTCSATDIPTGSSFTMGLNILPYMYTVFTKNCVCVLVCVHICMHVLCCVHVYTCLYCESENMYA